jgi:hypothetical protein
MLAIPQSSGIERLPMGTLENPAVLMETHITLASALHPDGEATTAALLRFRALQRTHGGRLEEVQIPPLLLERPVLQELVEGLSLVLDRIGGSMANSPPAQGLQ